MKTVFDLIGEKLPKNIMDSELDDVSKKIIVRLIYWLKHSQARETGIIKISNKKLMDLLGMTSTRKLMASIEELEDYSLIDRVRGTKLGNASRYIIHFDKFTQPLKRKSEEQFLKELSELQKPLKSPFGLDIDNDIDNDIDKDKDMDKNKNTDRNINIESDIEKDNDADVEKEKNTNMENISTVEKDNLINNSINSNNIVTDYVNKQLEDKTTYSEIVKQFTPIHQWIFSNWSNDNAERLVTVANKLINERLKKFETIKTETVDVDSCQSVKNVAVSED